MWYSKPIVTTKQKVVKKRARLAHHVKQALVPRRQNGYHPHLIRAYGIAAVLVVVVAVQLGYNALAGSSVLGAEAQVTVSGLLADTNAERVQNHLPALNLNNQLDTAAQLKAANMFKEQYWAHTAPDGTPPWHWFTIAGYNYDYAGENLAKNFSTSGATVAAWMASPTHRANILDTHYTDVGFAVENGQLQGQPTLIVVALYGSPVKAGVAGAQTSNFSAPASTDLSFVARIGVGLESLTPAALGSIALLILVVAVGLATYAARNRLPKNIRRGWAHHHGLIKAAGMASLAVIIVALYSTGGQI